DNLYDFINLMDVSGELVFSDRQAGRMERAMANIEFGFGEGNYQASEFIKRHLPKGTFDLMVVDEAHEYKGGSSAQGQAMGVLASGVRKSLLLTGTLMGGYADDLFFLLFRILTRQMLEDGYRPGRNGSLNAAAMQFMRDHGVLKEVFSERNDE
ncbi:TPA: DEAD/DEAH box helicase, partial [Salmonella enterica subsp. diarizonae serovar 61:l,v:z35]